LLIRASAALALLERQRSRIEAVADQQVERDLGRAVATEHQVIEQRTPGVIERNQIAVEYMALWA
jgi:hypothetical protein